jgi:hypothetical protein
MPSQSENPAIPLELRGLTLVASLTLLVVGLGLFFVPALARALWPWPLGAFDELFLGAVWLAALAAVGLLLYYAGWWPARLVLPMLFVFTGGLLIVSLLHLNQFSSVGWSTFAWFALLLAFPVITGYFLWRYREQAAPLDYPTPAPWRNVLQGLALALGLYGLALFLLPGVFGAFWPWPVSSFDGQLYSVVFTTAAIGAFGLSQWAAPVERLTLGAAYAVLGLFSPFGALIADADQHEVSWSAPGVWLWCGLFAILFLVGLALIWWSSGLMQGGT